MADQIPNEAETFAPLEAIECQVEGFPLHMQPAVNINQRRPVVDGADEAQVDIILVHYTAMQSANEAIDWLCCEKSQVSCHYLIDESGEITQMVSEKMRAWHAGQGSWQGLEDVNSRSIGIELANIGPSVRHLEYGNTDVYPDFPDVQIQATIALIKDCLTRHQVPIHNILAHSDIAPARKVDPGERFPWHVLSQHGLGAWVEPEPIASGPFLQLGDQGQAVEALQTMLNLVGYGLEINSEFDELTKNCVAAFQRHFRQEKVDGIADTSTVKTLHKLLTLRNSIV